MLAVLAVVTGYLAVDSWRGEADLRDLDGLTRASATVVEHDNQRRRADLLRVEFTAGDAAQQATIPYSGPAREGDEVEVAHVPGDPARARTVDGWSPAYERWAIYSVVLVVLAVVLGAFGVVSRLRRGRWEVDTPVGEAPREQLGRRIVRGSLAVQLGTAAAGAVIGAAMFVGAAVRGTASLAVAGAILFCSCSPSLRPSTGGAAGTASGRPTTPSSPADAARSAPGRGARCWSSGWWSTAAWRPWRPPASATGTTTAPGRTAG